MNLWLGISWPYFRVSLIRIRENGVFLNGGKLLYFVWFGLVMCIFFFFFFFVVLGFESKPYMYYALSLATEPD